MSREIVLTPVVQCFPAHFLLHSLEDVSCMEILSIARFRLVSIIALLVAGAIIGFNRDLDEVSFAEKSYKVPQGCKAVSEYSLECRDYDVHWMYSSSAQIESLANYAAGQLYPGKPLREWSTFSCTVKDEPANGYTAPSEKGQNAFIIQAVIEEQPVLVYGHMTGDPTESTSFPPFVKQLFSR